MSAAEGATDRENNATDMMNMNSGNTAGKLNTGDTDATRKGNRLDYDSDNPLAEAKKTNVPKRRGHNGTKKPAKSKKKGKRRGQHRVVADLFLALSLCHNVTPVITVEEPQDSEVMMSEP